jgi:hypothetical protein
MTALPGVGHPRGTEGPPPGAPTEELALFARLERLVGEEAALLAIPARERTREQHDRLRGIAEELDKMFETLRSRANRLGRHGRAAGESTSEGAT